MIFYRRIFKLLQACLIRKLKQSKQHIFCEMGEDTLNKENGKDVRDISR